jgi:hypothetical protein
MTASIFYWMIYWSRFHLIVGSSSLTEATRHSPDFDPASSSYAIPSFYLVVDNLLRYLYYLHHILFNLGVDHNTVEEIVY